MAAGWLDSEFDARLLSQKEKRFVQAALVFSGDYAGLLDGAWGKASQQALEAYTLRTAGNSKPALRDLTPLLAAFERERTSGGWTRLYFSSTNTSYEHPANLVVRDPDRSIIKYESSDGRLSLFVTFDTIAGTLELHKFVSEKELPWPEPYHNFKPNRLISSVTLPDGMVAYVRSDEIDGLYITLSVIGGEENRTRVALLASSMQRGEPPELDVVPGSLLATILSDPSSKYPTPNASDAHAPDDPMGASDAARRPPAATGDVTGSGTGFFINNTDLVTAAHVVQGCSRLTLADGSDLSVTAIREDLDLAVISSSERSSNWLELSSETSAQLGEPVTVLGYPYLGQLGTGLTATTGNVSARQGLGGSKTNLMISAPVQPGNSGGPLLNRDGAVIGVVVARLDDMKVLESTGSLPQNMNFAVPNDVLTGFLRDAHVTYPVSAPAGVDLSSGIPDAVAAAVVPVFCHG